MTLPDPEINAPREFDTSLCANCGEPASFVDSRPGANPVGYCAKDLPAELQVAAASGHLEVASGGLEQTGKEELPELNAEAEIELAVDKAAAKVDKATSRR